MLLLFLIGWVSAIYYVYYLIAYRPRSLKGNVVLITGGGNGLGRQMALQFGALGCRIVLWDIDRSGLQKVESELTAAHIDCRIFVVDITNATKVYETAKTVGDIDILINNAGIVTGKKLMECSDAMVEKTFAVNTLSHFYTLRAFLPSMIQRRSGHVVTIASAAGLSGTAGLVDYCGSKFAAVGAHESLYIELHKQRIPVKTTLVCPFYINTGMFNGVKTKWHSILPILEEEYAASRIVQSVQRGDEMLLMPRAVILVYYARLLPVTWQVRLASFFGIIDSMDDFKGRAQKAKNN